MRRPWVELTEKHKEQLERIQEHVSDAVTMERDSQNYKWGLQRLDMGEWMSILVEEVGELAQAINKDTSTGKSTDPSNKYEEAIQVAAVAQAIAEQLIEEQKRR